MYSNNQYYKGKYFIAFYDADGEEFINCFDNIYKILLYINKPTTKENYTNIKNIIYFAVKKNKLVYFLDGKPRRIYLIEI